MQSVTITISNWCPVLKVHNKRSNTFSTNYHGINQHYVIKLKRQKQKKKKKKTIAL